MTRILQTLRMVAWAAVAATGLAESGAAPLKLITWNAQSLTNVADRASTMDARLNSAALHLQGHRPDVLLLQGVPDWTTAQKLATRLGPEFKLVACSSLDEKESGEVAVISRLESGLSWPDRWSPLEGTNAAIIPGGYALATLRFETQWIAVVSVEFPDTVGALKQRESAMRELLTLLASVGEWRTNRPGAFIFGGALNTDEEESARTAEQTLRLADAARFTSAFLAAPKSERLTVRGKTQHAATTADYLFADAGGFLAAAEVQPNILSDHAMVAVQWDPAATMPLPPVLAAVGAGGTGMAANQLMGLDLKWWVAGLGCFVVVMFLLVLFRRPQPVFDASRALPSSRGANILFLSDSEKAANQREDQLTERERRRLRPSMLGWLKEKFIGQLVSERQEMLDAQHLASEQAVELGRRVEKLQGQLFERIKTAERRVQDLEKELALAKAENRELIQSNLLLAQRELEDARRKMEAGGR